MSQTYEPGEDTEIHTRKREEGESLEMKNKPKRGNSPWYQDLKKVKKMGLMLKKNSDGWQSTTSLGKQYGAPVLKVPKIWVTEISPWEAQNTMVWLHRDLY